MAVIKCKMCGGDLILTEGSSVAECAYCGTTQTVPCLDNEKKINLFSRANRLRSNCEFDRAFGVYEAIVADFPEEAEAYWGLVLCKYGIEYVDDPATGRKVPTCHRSSFDSVMEDTNFEQALENATTEARKIYRDEAKQIEELRKGILEVSSKEEPYDIFICYKESTDDNQRTIDSVLAQDIYDALTEKKYKVFFARITLEKKLGHEYEPYIFAALNSAKVMLVVGTDYEHFNAVWVRNEWSRYLKLMESDKGKYLIPCFKDIDAYDMPKEFSRLQAQDMGKIGAMQDLVYGIKKIMEPSGDTPVQAVLNNSKHLEVAKTALKEKKWDLASKSFDLALVADAECAEAYIGKIMAECKISSKENFEKNSKPLDKFAFYPEACRYATAEQKQELEHWNKSAKKRRTKKCVITTIATILIIAVALFTAWKIVENKYQTTLRNFYSGTATAEQVKALEWYETPDIVTLYLLNKANPGLYPDGNVLKSVTELVIPDGVTEIPNKAFIGCTNFTSVTIPDSVTSIGASAFSGCTELASITIPNSVTHIGSSAFYNCKKLASVTIPDSVTSIGGFAFKSCTGLTSVTIPNSVTNIDSQAFYGCTGLTSVTIPNSVTNIDFQAFYGCTGLTSVTILSNQISNMGDLIFDNCGKLSTVYCTAEEPKYVGLGKGWSRGWLGNSTPTVIWNYKG